MAFWSPYYNPSWPGTLVPSPAGGAAPAGAVSAAQKQKQGLGFFAAGLLWGGAVPLLLKIIAGGAMLVHRSKDDERAHMFLGGLLLSGLRGASMWKQVGIGAAAVIAPEVGVPVAVPEPGWISKVGTAVGWGAEAGRGILSLTRMGLSVLSLGMPVLGWGLAAGAAIVGRAGQEEGSAIAAGISAGFAARGQYGHMWFSLGMLTMAFLQREID